MRKIFVRLIKQHIIFMVDYFKTILSDKIALGFPQEFWLVFRRVPTKSLLFLLHQSMILYHKGKIYAPFLTESALKFLERHIPIGYLTTRSIVSWEGDKSFDIPSQTIVPSKQIFSLLRHKK